MKKTHVVIGASAAAIGVLSKLRALAPNDEIICIAAQTDMPFNTCLLANYLSTGMPPAGLYTRPDSFFKRNNIQLHLGTTIKRIEPDTNRVFDHLMQQYCYDTLFLGVGTRPRVLPADFIPQSGYFKFTELYDVLAIEEFLKSRAPKTAIVVGAGLSGVECADALTERGIRVTLIDTSSFPLPRLLIPEAGALLEKRMREAGTTFYQTAQALHALVEPFSKRTVGVLMQDGLELFADMVVSTIGPTNHFDLLEQATSRFYQRGVIVDTFMRTEVPNIYCGGDAATVPTPQWRPGGKIFADLVRSCTWPDAVQHGMIAAHAMADKPIEYAGAVVIQSSHFYGTQVVSAGEFFPFPELKPIIYQGEDWYHYFMLKGDSLESFFMLGNIRNVGLYRRLMATKESFDLAILDPFTIKAPTIDAA